LAVSFIEYIFTVLFSVFVIAAIIALVYSFYYASIRSEIQEELKQMAVQAADNVVKLYETAQSSEAVPSNYTSVMISEVDLRLPDSVSKRNYQMLLASSNTLWSSISSFEIGGQNATGIEETGGAKIVVQTLQSPIITVEQDIPNIDIAVMGKSENGQDSKLRYYRHNVNGTIYDTIVLGNSTMLVAMTSTS